MSCQSTQPTQQNPFSLIEIDGNLYYISSLDIDECIINYSHTMPTPLLETFVKYAGGLLNDKVTAVVFKNINTTSQEKKVVGFWNPQLTKFILNSDP